MKHAGFQHQALIYEGIDEYLAGTVPFIEAAIEADEPVLVAVHSARAEWLKGALTWARSDLRFVPMEEVGGNPALIISFWREFIDAHRGRPVRGIGEPAWAERSPAALEECHRHEALLDLAFAEDPEFSLLCTYDAAALPSHVLERIAVSHRDCRAGGSARRGTGCPPALGCFAGRLPPPAAAPDTFEFGVEELAEVRQRVAAAAERAGLGPLGVADLVTAASELAANSVMHGGGAGTLRLWQEGGKVLAEVEDRGRIEDPLVGRLRPDLAQEGGRGLWLANRLCELVQIRSGESGTVVRLHMHAGEDPPGFGRRQPDPRTEASQLRS